MLNHIELMGRLTADPELRTTENGDIPVCGFSIAVPRPKRKDSEQITDFFNCVAWRGTAKIVCDWFGKGDIIILEGTLRNRHYLDKHNVKRTVAEVLVEKVHFTNSTRKNPDEKASELPDSPPGLEGMADVNPDDFAEFLDDDGVPF